MTHVTLTHLLIAPGEVAKEFAKLTALIPKKSHAKRLKASWVTTTAIDSRLADIAHCIT